MTAILKIKRHSPELALPAKAHSTDAGIDIVAVGVEPRRDRVFFFNTGISVEISEGYYIEVVPRSSITKTDFIMANSVGVIDPDYRGIIMVPLRYVGTGDPVQAAQKLINTRIAQLLVRKLEPCMIEDVTDLSSTARNDGGFGSTGA
ncbi:MAG: dUTP diphosphatase [SAR324 cluster bacterium]|nr:dUTP diphosphatase [SAR324 cluster bacterium]